MIVIIKIINKGKIPFRPEIFNYCNEGPCSWYDFAVEIIKLMGINCKIYPIESQDYLTLAKRPLYSVLNTNKIRNAYNIEIPRWNISLEKCIHQLIETGV